MNLFADESIERQIVERLRSEGHAVLYIAEMEPGISDDTVLDRANEHNALLLTADKDFGELVYRLKRLTTGGVVLTRLSGLSSERKAEIVATAMRDRAADLPQSFSVISPGTIRVRK